MSTPAKTSKWKKWRVTIYKTSLFVLIRDEEEERDVQKRNKYFRFSRLVKSGRCGSTATRYYSLHLMTPNPAHLAPVKTQWGNSTFWDEERDYTERLKHFLLSFSLSWTPSHGSLLTLAEGVNYGSLQLPCSPLTGRADTCQRAGDPRSQRGLWAGTQSKPGRETFSFGCFSTLMGWI